MPTTSTECPRYRSVGKILLVTVAGLAFFDVLCGLFRSPHTMGTLPILAKAIVYSALAFLLLYGAVALMLGPWLTHVLRLRAVSVAVTLSAFWCCLVVGSLLTLGTRIPRGGAQIRIFLMCAATAVIAALLAYPLAARLSRSDFVRSVAGRFALAGVWLLATIVGLLWLSHHGGSTLARGGLALGGFLCLLGVLIGGAASRSRRAGLLIGWAALIVACVAWGGAAASATRSTATLDDGLKVPHVILVVIDTLRADALSCYGDAGTRTPNLDQFAAEGVRFERAISAAPWTVPGVASIMTGLTPLEHGAARGGQMLPNEVKTLAEYLVDMGYSTTAIGQNPQLTPLVSNLNQGFETYAVHPHVAADTIGDKLIERILHRLRGRIPEVSTTQLTDSAIAWAQASAESPSFLWLHYFDPHLPYAPPARYLEGTKRSPQIGNSFVDLPNIRAGHFIPTAEDRLRLKELYLAEVRYVDDEIGRFFAALKEQGIYDDALIIVTSDHGEEFWEHNGFEHGHTLYNEVIHVPLIVKAPGGQPRGVVAQPVGTVGIVPTVLELCAAEFEPDDLSARSLAPLLANPDVSEGASIIMSTGLAYYENRIALQFEQYKYIQSLVSGREELYDLAADPREHASLLRTHEEIVKRSQALLGEGVQAALTLKQRLEISDPDKAELDDQTLRQLRSLGYLGD